MKPPAPSRVGCIEDFWITSPPKLSDRCTWWVARIEAGWRPNRRISGAGYSGSAAYYGVYIWEYLNVISPRLAKLATSVKENNDDG